MYLRFISDASVQRKGFQATHSTGACVRARRHVMFSGNHLAVQSFPRLKFQLSLLFLGSTSPSGGSQQHLHKDKYDLTLVASWF